MFYFIYVELGDYLLLLLLFYLLPHLSVTIYSVNAEWSVPAYKVANCFVILHNIKAKRFRFLTQSNQSVVSILVLCQYTWRIVVWEKPPWHENSTPSTFCHYIHKSRKKTKKWMKKLSWWKNFAFTPFLLVILLKICRFFSWDIWTEKHIYFCLCINKQDK